MLKLIATILAFFYLFSATGINVHMHYCMGELGSWGLVSNNSAVCSICGMEKSAIDGGCCNDETVFLKNTSDQQNTEISVKLPQIYISAPAVPLADILPVYISTLAINNLGYLQDIRSKTQPVYLFNCIFRI